MAMEQGWRFYILLKPGSSHSCLFRSKVEGDFDSKGSTRKSGQGWLLDSLWASPLDSTFKRAGNCQSLLLPGPRFTEKQDSSGVMTKNGLSD